MLTDWAKDVNQLGLVVPVSAGSGTNAAVVISLAGATRERHHLMAVWWSYSATPTGGNLVTTGLEGDEINIDVAAAGFNVLSTQPLVGASGSAVTVTLAAGGAGIVGKLAVSYVTLPG